MHLADLRQKIEGILQQSQAGSEFRVIIRDVEKHRKYMSDYMADYRRKPKKRKRKKG